jgi:exopolysaccharide biosynthesis WecB/TagA/CpsF family protein
MVRHDNRTSTTAHPTARPEGAAPRPAVGVNSEPAAAAETRVLGVDFFPGSLAGACQLAAEGGLLTAPSGPGLAYDLVREPAYRRALEQSDVVLTDSAFMVLLWRLRTGRRLPRNSGLAFLRIWMNRDVMRRPGAVLWVMPSLPEMRHTLRWLTEHDYPVAEEDFYVAPSYGPGAIVDDALVAQIERRRPEVVYLGIGGGVQERLGHHLRNAVSYRPVILCLGAALAFITGAQVQIPRWVDRWGLGWFWRIASNPSRYGGRYVRATRLAWLVFRYGVEAPPLPAVVATGNA